MQSGEIALKNNHYYYYIPTHGTHIYSLLYAIFIYIYIMYEVHALTMCLRRLCTLHGNMALLPRPAKILVSVDSKWV